MTIAYIYHPDCLLHDMGEGHPECPARIEAIEDQLKASHLFDFLRHYEAPLATVAQLARVHDKNYISRVLSYSKLEAYVDAEAPHAYLDPDTLITPKTPQAALRSSGAAIMATDLVMTGKTKAAFCCVRPPGHHALRGESMGFCFFDNVAVGAAHAIAEYGLQRVAIVDFDVHHGNGTEDIVKDNPNILFCSTFQHPFYPYCGTEETASNIINAPLAAGSDGEKFRAAVSEHWLPALHKFMPQMIFISAGFDAHYDDDMSSLRLVERDYAWVTQELLHIADKYGEGRVVSTLEGGYELHSLGRSVTAHLRVLMRMN
ncbi:histone deacetylase family protein [Beggiatoa leptomitoformis]|uniref:Histone deacetylase family protein n=1 Tax=Beggiatoa leptomitoformis TaxID=288004 RepID=A0A2N9YBU6_9GAMM|nr:histone deacetylase family protein [Beggiatoa leptomitoformis]ALG66724.1 histone deacetylase family protein [Beggiatoa leptomitoformis]AUI67943.1 histone deacetylase family protein [Beggiatoa leptomitoformis]